MLQLPLPRLPHQTTLAQERKSWPNHYESEDQHETGSGSKHFHITWLGNKWPRKQRTKPHQQKKEKACTSCSERAGSGGANLGSLSQCSRAERSQKDVDRESNNPLANDSTLAASSKDRLRERLEDKLPTNLYRLDLH